MGDGGFEPGAYRALHHYGQVRRQQPPDADGAGHRCRMILYWDFDSGDRLTHMIQRLMDLLGLGCLAKVAGEVELIAVRSVGIGRTAEEIRGCVAQLLRDPLQHGICVLPRMPSFLLNVC